MNPPKRALQARSAERREAILLASLDLFIRQGYEATSVNSIIATLGISKGSFYHHFAGKEAVLDAALESQLEQVAQHLDEAMMDDALDGIALVNMVLAAAWQSRNSGPDEQTQQLMAQTAIAMLKRENAPVLDRLIVIERRVAVALVTRVITRGIRDGSFQVTDAAIAASTLYNLAAAVHLEIFRGLIDGQVDLAAAEQQLRFLYLSMERILQCPVGREPCITGGLPETLQLYDALLRELEPGPDRTEQGAHLKGV